MKRGGVAASETQHSGLVRVGRMGQAEELVDALVDLYKKKS